MKKIIFLALIGICGLMSITSCSNDDKGTVPVSLDQASISYEALPGAVKLKWTIPAGANYKYIKVTYTIPDTQKKCMRLASVYSDTLMVNNLLKRYGNITFTLQTVSEDGGVGNTCTIDAQSLAATKTILFDKTAISVDANHVWSDDPESSEGPIKNLVNGKTDDYFHMSWSDSKPFPHYIVFDLGTQVSAISFNYTCRNNNNKDNPKEMDILVSDSFENTATYYTGETGTTKIASLSDLPNTKAASYDSAPIVSSKPFRFVWFKIKSATSGADWVALAEMGVNKVKMSVYDPETGKTTVTE